MSASGLTPETRAFAYAMWSPDSTPACRDVSVAANQVGDDLVGSDGSVSFDLTVASPAFQVGNHNYLCVIDGFQRGVDLAPKQLRVVERPPHYRMKLDISRIVQAPDDDFFGGALGRNLAVVDGRHWDNWRLPQRRSFGAADRLGYVTNLGESVVGDSSLYAGISAGVSKANSFSTGVATSERFRISSVVVEFGANAHNARVGVYSNDATDATAGDQPGVQVGSDLIWSDVGRSGEVTFTASDVVLDAGATYWLVLKSSVAQGSQEPKVKTTDINGQDSVGVAGWTIGDNHKFREGGSGNWSDVGGGRSLRFRVNASKAPAKGVEVNPTELSVPEGGRVSYAVSLLAPPAADVTITIARETGGDSDLTVDTDTSTTGNQNTLTFTPANWTTVQAVYVSAAQDSDRTNDSAAFTHTASSDDIGYRDLTIAPVTATEIDDEDNEAPTFSSAEVDGATLTVTFSEAMDRFSRPDPMVFRVTVDGPRRDVLRYFISGRTAVLTLAGPVAPGQTVGLAYTKPSSGTALRDLKGNAVATFERENVSTLSSDGDAPTFESAVVDEDTVLLIFNEDLVPVSLPRGAFRVSRPDQHVTNVPESSVGDFLGIGGGVANAFATGGSKLDRFELKDVVVGFGAGGDSAAVRIYSNGSGNVPGTLMGSALTRLADAATGEITFNPPAGGIVLNGDTTYWLVVDSSAATTELAGVAFTTASSVNDKSLSANNITQTGARLVISGHTGAWWHQNERGSACVSVSAGTDSSDLTGLYAGASYTYKAYSDSDGSCSTELGSVSFTTVRVRPDMVSLAAVRIASTEATLAIYNHTGAWWYRQEGTTACVSVSAGVGTVTLTGLTASESYTYKAYSDETCSTGASLSSTASDAETGSSGWSIGDSAYEYDSASSTPWSVAAHARAVRFRVNVTSSIPIVDAPVIRGRTVTLILASAVAPGDTGVEVSYTPPSSGDVLKDAAGNEVAGFDFSFAEDPVHFGPLVEGPLVTTYGQWHRCEDRFVSGSNVRLGCEWDERPVGDSSQDKVYLEQAGPNAPPVSVPGDVVQLRIFLNDADLGVRKAAERYVVFWGPVDIWLLGGTGGVRPQDFVIQQEHLVGIRHRLVLQSELEDGAITLDLGRATANRRGDTFVSLVPCNDDYLESKFSGAEFNRVQQALRDCSELSVGGLGPLAGDEPIVSEYRSFPADTGFSGGVTDAWSRHRVRAGLGLECDMRVTSRTEGEGTEEVTVYNRTIDCKNKLAEPVTRDEYDECMTALGLRRPGVGVWEDLKCGMGHYDRPVGDIDASAVWGTTRYNAARSFYGFVINWQDGPSDGEGRPGCDVNLLPYRIIDGKYVGILGSGTGEWLTGEVGGESDEDCIADPGEDEVAVGFYTPESGDDESRPPWSDSQKSWHDTHPVHFAVYVSGMASEYGGDPGAEGIADWKRVSLGSWEVGESNPYRRARGFTRLGLWYPHSASGFSEVSGVRLPSISDMTGGKELTVPRDFAGSDGVVRLFVVPCLPVYTEGGVDLGVCEDLPARTGPISGVRFGLESLQTGPFGYDRNSSVISYSVGVTVIFRSGPGGEGVSRSVSHPPVIQEPAGDVCGITSVAPNGGSSYWPEVTVRGGACDRSDLNVVPVNIANASGAADDRLVVYATGGRTEDLERVRMGRAGVDAGDREFGRLGLRERVLSLAVGESSETLHVSPDLANRRGEVWLVAYSCGGASRSARCPTVNRDRVPVVYDIAVPSAFVIVVKFTAAAGLKHTELAPVCHGDDCDLEVGRDVPILREAPPEGVADSCEVSSYADGNLWPDRVVRGGACKPVGLNPVSVRFSQPGNIQHNLVVFTTGGRTPGWETVQVNRGGLEGRVPAGAVGLRRVQLSASGQVLVDPDLADAQGQVLLLAYLCSDSSDATQPTDAANCPSGRGDSLTEFHVSRRPLFQILVEYDAGQLLPSGFAICRGDECRKSYPLGRVSPPRVNQGCGVSAVMSNGRLHWPNGVIAGGDCDRDDLNDVPVQLVLPEGSGSRKVALYVTGGRTAGLSETRVFAVSGDSPSDSGASNTGYHSELMLYSPYIAPLVPSSGFSARAVAESRLLAEHNTNNVRWMSRVHPDLFQTLESKAWVQDGLTGLEKKVIDYFIHLVGSEEDTAAAATRVVAMPFMSGIDELDLLTMRGLVHASREGTVYSVLDHPNLSSGITDAHRVTVIAVTTIGDSSKVTSRLTQSYNVSPGFSCPGVRDSVTVTVVRVGPAVRGDIGSLTCSAVSGAEGVMDKALPVGQVILIFDRDSVPTGAGGANYGYATSYLPKYEVEGSSSSAVIELQKTIIHEVAHYYWTGDRRWIDEGLASAFEYILGQQAPFNLPKDSLLRERGECDLPNLRVREEKYDPMEYDPGACDYYLGQRLFVHLFDSLRSEKFNQGLRRFYALVERCSPGRGRECPTYEDLRTAFPDGAAIIDEHWGPPNISVDSGKQPLGRLGLREQKLTIGDGGRVSVSVSPDLASEDGEVWLLVYGCSASHGDTGCPLVQRPPDGGFDLPKGPDFAVRVKFTEESGLQGADLREVCSGPGECGIRHPWLRQAEPSGDECAVQLSSHWDFWPDRVIRGGGCYFRGENYGSVDFRASAAEKFVVYTTGDAKPGLELVSVHGVLGDDDNVEAEQLGRSGLRETRVELAAGGQEQVWVRSDMSDDDGNVWLFVYRCLVAYGDAGCPLVGRDAIRPSYDVPIRPAFVVRVGFLELADQSRSSFDVVCTAGSSTCSLTAIFRDSDGNSLPGTVEFRVDRGSLGTTGSTATSSRRGHTLAGDGEYRFEETLHLPAAGGVVNVQAELLGDGLILRRQAGSAGAADRISVRVMRCSGDEASCHDDGLEEVQGLFAGDHFVLGVTGYDVAGDEVFDTGSVSKSYCVDGPTGPGAEFMLKSRHLRSHVYGVSDQPDDRGYAGCAIRVLPGAPVGSYNVVVSYGTMTVPVQVRVIVDTSHFGFLGLTGETEVKSGESAEYTVRGYTLAGAPAAFDDGCLKLSLIGALEAAESGSGTDGCLAEGLPKDGFKFTVTAQEDVLYSTDSSVGVAFGGHSKVMHVLVVPAEETAAPPPVVPSSSHITNLTITPEGSQLRVSWTGSPTADFESLRAQVWVVIGGENVFLPGCMGGEALDVSTQEVFCMLSYGQSGDVYQAAVGFLRRDGSAVPVETAQWVRP